MSVTSEKQKLTKGKKKGSARKEKKKRERRKIEEKNKRGEDTVSVGRFPSKGQSGRVREERKQEEYRALVVVNNAL